MFEGPVQDLIDELGKLPGIGPKSAQRIAFHLLSVEPPDIDRLTAVLAKVRDGVRFCAVCGNVSDNERSGASALLVVEGYATSESTFLSIRSSSRTVFGLSDMVLLNVS